MSVQNVTISDVPLLAGGAVDLTEVRIIDMTLAEMQTLGQLVNGIKATVGAGAPPPTPAGAMRWLLQQLKTAAGQ